VSLITPVRWRISTYADTARTQAGTGTTIGTSAVTVGDRDIERLEAENAPVYVPFTSGCWVLPA
jgi:hypothetical protein